MSLNWVSVDCCDNALKTLGSTAGSCVHCDTEKREILITYLVVQKVRRAASKAQLWHLEGLEYSCSFESSWGGSGKRPSSRRLPFSGALAVGITGKYTGQQIQLMGWTIAKIAQRASSSTHKNPLGSPLNNWWGCGRCVGGEAWKDATTVVGWT